MIFGPVLKRGSPDFCYIRDAFNVLLMEVTLNVEKKIESANFICPNKTCIG